MDLKYGLFLLFHFPYLLDKFVAWACVNRCMHRTSTSQKSIIDFQQHKYDYANLVLGFSVVYESLSLFASLL